MPTVKSPLAPAYKQREGLLPTDVSGWGETLRDRTDAARVQTRADTSLNIQTKLGRIIRTIIQQRSESTYCEPVSFVGRA